MVIPKKEKHSRIIEINFTSPFLYKKVSFFIHNKPMRYADNNPTRKIKFSYSKEHKKALKDCKALNKVMLRLEKHGWENTDSSLKEEVEE